MVKPLTKRICLLCGRRGDSRVLCFTRTKYRNTVVLLSSLVLFNEMDLEEAKRCYDLGKRRGICDTHYIDAARLITSELACLGIAIASYVAQPSGELVSYVDEKDLPLHLVDSIQAIARRMDENLDIDIRKIRDFLNTCLYRYGTDFLHPTTSVADSQLEGADAASNPEADKRTALLCGTSTTPEFAVPNHSVKEECDGYIIEEVEETDPDILERTFPVRGDRLLSLFRFCPKCGTQISRKRRRLVLSETGPSPVVQYICNTCGGKRCWYAI
ncbi:hypothetical protein ANCCAN_20364 [Ancylostoma caninum]|uniref:Lin-15A/B-like domain-containing protein n=1 Tax=Ancylostoma caninum TaxID=29170 RepID=A0A368FSK1_ANCCA|nr:hypothetical protein ANCCAN_20364 [Ancylostoma caninum]